MALNLNGLIPATVLPMDADGRIDEPALRSYIGWVAGQGPVALAINVDTGEGPHLTHDEKVRVLGIVRDATHLPIVAGRHRLPQDLQTIRRRKGGGWVELENGRPAPPSGLPARWSQKLRSGPCGLPKCIFSARLN